MPAKFSRYTVYTIPTACLRLSVISLHPFSFPCFALSLLPHISTPSSLPRYNHSTQLLGMSYAQFHPSELGRFGATVLNLLSTLRLVAMETNVGDKKDEIRVNNLTIINFVLKTIGPTHERTLTVYMLGIQVRLFSAVCWATSVLGIQVRLFSAVCWATSVLGIQVRLFSGCVLGYQCTGDTGTLVQWLCAGYQCTGDTGTLVQWLCAGYQCTGDTGTLVQCWATSVLGIQVRLFSGCVLGYQCTGDTGTLVQWLCAGLPVYWGYRYACSVAVCWATSVLGIQVRLFSGCVLGYQCTGDTGTLVQCCVLGYQCTGDTGTLVQWLCAGLPVYWGYRYACSVLCAGLPVYWGYRYACSVAVCWATSVLGIQVRLFSGCVLGYQCTGIQVHLFSGCVLGYQCTGDTGTLVQWPCAMLHVDCQGYVIVQGLPDK